MLVVTLPFKDKKKKKRNGKSQMGALKVRLLRAEVTDGSVHQVPAIPA